MKAPFKSEKKSSPKRFRGGKNCTANIKTMGKETLQKKDATLLQRMPCVFDRVHNLFATGMNFTSHFYVVAFFVCVTKYFAFAKRTTHFECSETFSNYLTNDV